jgi:hypothetical protein
VRPAKKKLKKYISQWSEEIYLIRGTVDLFVSYYKQRAAHMLATDEQVLAFKGHPAMFTTS